MPSAGLRDLLVVGNDTYTAVHMYKALIHTFTETLAHTHKADMLSSAYSCIPGPPLILGPGTRAQFGHQTLLGRI